METETIQDVNTETEASAASNADVNTEGASSASVTEVKPSGPRSAEDIVAEVLKKNEDAGAEPSTAAESAVKEEKPVEKEKPEAPKEEGAEGSKHEKAIPYERFKEINDQYQAAKPDAERMRGIDSYLQAKGVTPDDFKASLDLLALIRENPAEAHRRLAPIVEQLGKIAGEALPEDLAKDVAEGVLSEERARELSRFRAGTQINERNARQSEQQRAEAAQREIVSSLDAWTKTKAASDPDFKPKGSETETDGLYEMTFAKFALLAQTERPSTPQAFVKLVDKAYADTKAYAQRFVPRSRTRRALTSTRSSVEGQEKPKSEVARVLAKYGVKEPALA